MSLTIGQTIKKLRKERNVTQAELAEQLNVTFQAVSKWENEMGLPDISQVVPLTSVFGISSDVLFGIDVSSEKDEVRDILERAYHLDENQKLDVRHRYNELQIGLKKYPNNFWLLQNCLETGQALSYPKSAHYDQARGQEIYHECIRMANIITTYSKEVTDVLRAHMIMVILHSAYENTEKAWEHANNFPWRSDFTIQHMSAYISHFEENFDDSAKYARENVNFSLEALADAMMQLAYAYEHMQRKDYALIVYIRVKELIELFPDDEHFSTPTVWREWGQLDELILKMQL